MGVAEEVVVEGEPLATFERDSCVLLGRRAGVTARFEDDAAVVLVVEIGAQRSSADGRDRRVVGGELAATRARCRRRRDLGFAERADRHRALGPAPEYTLSALVFRAFPRRLDYRRAHALVRIEG